MGFLCLSVTSKRSGLTSLAKLSSAQSEAVVRRVMNLFSGAEGVPLRTCNRFETYHYVPEAVHGEVREHLLTLKLARGETLIEGPGVVEHVFMVASGMDSELVGEDEILGQVRSAYLNAKEHGDVRRELSELFERAIHVGRRVRNEIPTNGGALSLSRLAIDEARKTIPRFEEARIAVLGAGQMGEKILSRLIEGGAKRILISSRVLAKRRALVRRWPVTTLNPEDLIRRLNTVDVLFCAADSEIPLLRISPSTLGKRRTPLTIVDLGVPSNVEIQGEVKMVRLTNMRKLQSLSRRISRGKTQAIRAGRAIVNDEVQLFVKEREERDVARFAERLFERAERVAAEERFKALPRLHGGGDGTEVMRNMTSSLIKRLFLPSVAVLKELPPSKRARAIEVAEQLLIEPVAGK